MERIRELIKGINSLYINKKLDTAQERLSIVWNKQYPKDRIPFVFGDYFPEPDNGFDWYDYYEAKYSKEKHLFYGLKLIENRAFIDDDYIPTLFPGCRQALIPSMFGAKEKLRDYHFWVDPVIKNIRDINSIEHIRPKESQVFMNIYNRILFFRENIKGSLVTIHMPDIQGPVDIANVLLGTENLMMSMFDKPKEIHSLLEKITLILMETVDLLLDVSEGELIPFHAEPNVWVPGEQGFSFNEDLIAILSPDLFKEFALPYYNILSKKYGGFFTHSCGSFTQNLKNLLKINGFIGINFQVTEQDIFETLKVFTNKAVVVCGWADTVKYIDWSPEDHIRNTFSAIKKYKSPGVVMIPVYFESEGFAVADKSRIKEMNKLANELSKI